GIVMATGGGAFMDPRSRATIRERGLSVWLRADLELLLRRTSRRNNRPLLKRGNPRDILRGLIRERYPVYAEAEVTVDIDDSPPQVTTDRVRQAIEAHLAAGPGAFPGIASEAAQGSEPRGTPAP
ncbi:MAG: shikimate kinase, partial [Kiloniellales bacterium]